MALEEEDSSSELELSSEESSEELLGFELDFAELLEGSSELASALETTVSALETASGCEGYDLVGTHSSARMVWRL